jgi:hypothetical protein
MASKYMKKCSTSLVVKEMQIKTMFKFHLTLVRMAIFKSNNNNKCWRGWRKTGTFHTLFVGMQISTTIMESSMEIPQKPKHRTAL